MKQLAKISLHFVLNQYLVQISGTKLIALILLVLINVNAFSFNKPQVCGAITQNVMAPQTWGLLKKNVFT